MQCGFGVCSTASVYRVCGNTANGRSLALRYASKTLFDPISFRIVRRLGPKQPLMKYYQQLWDQVPGPRGVSYGSSVNTYRGYITGISGLIRGI